MRSRARASSRSSVSRAITQPLQRGRSLGLGITQRRQRSRRLRLAGGGRGLLAGAFRHHPDRQILGVLGGLELGIGGDEAQMEQGGFGLRTCSATTR